MPQHVIYLCAFTVRVFVEFLQAVPAELKFALAAHHVRATRVLPDQNSAARAWLSQRYLAEVVRQGLDDMRHADLGEECRGTLEWVLPRVAATTTDEGI